MLVDGRNLTLDVLVVISDTQVKCFLVIAIAPRDLLKSLAVEGIHRVDLKNDCHIGVTSVDSDPLDDTTTYVVLTSAVIADGDTQDNVGSDMLLDRLGH